MRIWVENGLAGCDLAVTRQAVAVVVDALRASATIASFLHFGAGSLVVVREVAEAFALRDLMPGALLAGERGGPLVPGFDLGNSPLDKDPGIAGRQVIFSSSNCSRCCLGVATAPAAFVGTTMNATATARAVTEACRQLDQDEVVLVTAGSAANELLFTLEDHLAAGAIMAALAKLCGTVFPANDRAEACRLVHADDQTTITERFLNCHNGRALTAMGLGQDVHFAARLDVFDVAPRIAELMPLKSGGQGAVVRKG